jgi:Tfp pilus assembly protein PilF
MAENYYRKAAKVDPDLPNAWFYLALLLEDKKEVKEAEELYHKAAYMNPEYGDAWHRLGMLLWEERRYKEAKEAFAMEHGCPLNAEQRKELQATMKSLDLLISESELQNRQH